MKRNFWRMIFALLVSVACFTGTHLWYASTREKSHSATRSKVGRLTEAHNEVQRKSVRDFIWEGLSGNDELFAGEQIRTLANSEAEIFLESSNATIRLEPNSLVILEKNEEGLSLDFLEGNLFVQKGQNGEMGVKVKSCTENKADCSEISLQAAELSLSRKGDDVSLEVFRGKAELQKAGKKISLTKDKAATINKHGLNLMTDRIQLLSPSAGEAVLINYSKEEKFEVRWHRLPPDYQVHAEIGATRSSLNRLESASVNGADGSLSFHQKPGKWFLKLVAQSRHRAQPQLISMITPFSIEPKASPALIEPATAQTILREKGNQEINFSWLNRNAFAKQTLEVSKDSQLKSLIINTEVDNQTHRYTSKLEDGTYYWRVNGFLKLANGKLEILSSPIANFRLTSQWEIKPAQLLSPTDHMRIAYFDAQRGGVTLKWQGDLESSRFKVNVSSLTESGTQTILEKDLDAPILKMTTLRPGDYQWVVTTVDRRTGQTQLSEKWRFSIDEISKLEWLTKNPEYTYTSPTPTLEAQWKALESEQPTKYRFRVVEDGSAIEDVPWKTTSQTQFATVIPREGQYQAVVEALNSQGHTVAKSDPKTFIVKRMPLLAPPRWKSDTPEVLQTDAKGNISFDWDPVEGAKNYHLILQNSQGQILQQKKVQRTTASVTNLKPGQYHIRIQSIDSFSRIGPEGPSKKLNVPKPSDIRAPRIKTLKVK